MLKLTYGNAESKQFPGVIPADWEGRKEGGRIEREWRERRGKGERGVI